MARFVGFDVAGVAPRVMELDLLRRSGLEKGGITINDVDRIELNEAFAAQSLAVIREMDLDQSKINPTGGAIALVILLEPPEPS